MSKNDEPERTEPSEPMEPAERTEPEEETSLLSDQEYNQMIEQMCTSKAQEFQMMGYEQVTGADIWKCVASKYKKEMPPLHRLVNDILTLKSNSFMNWLMIEAYKG